MNSPAVDLAGFLVDDSIGSIGDDIFISEYPSTPDSCISLFDTGGYEPEANYTYERPTVQVRIRGAKGDYRGAYAIAEAVREALHGRTNEVVSTTRYVAIWCSSDIMSLGLDENNRPEFSVNFRAHRTTT